MRRTTCCSQGGRIAGILLGIASLPAPGAITLDLDYTYDLGGFFTTERRDLMSLAATLFEARIEDTLSAITPGGGNNWTSEFYSPNDGSILQLVNPTIALGSIKVYLGARNLGSGVLGVGGFGGIASGSGSGAFVTAVSTRGQPGVDLNTDFGPWGGSIAFNNTASWHFDSDPATLESFAGQNDFYSVAVHELAHLLGLGTAPSWAGHVNGSQQFTGPAAVGSYGANISLVVAEDHFDEGVMSTLPGTATPQEALMDPTLTVGTRKYMTDLDWAAMEDIGWQVTAVPEPAPWVMLGVGGLFLYRLAGHRRMTDKSGGGNSKSS